MNDEQRTRNAERRTLHAEPRNSLVPRSAFIVPRSTAFTLIEVLATLTLIAIVIPVAMQGVDLATGAASDARQRNLASALCESKLSELVATGQLNSNQGDCSDNDPNNPELTRYHWQSTVSQWTQDSSLQELDVTVTWRSARKGDMSVTMSTLIYPTGSSTGGL